MPARIVVSKAAATMAVALTDDARSAGDRARMMRIARVPAVGSHAIMPSAVGRVRETAIFPWLPEPGVPRWKWDRAG